MKKVEILIIAALIIGILMLAVNNITTGGCGWTKQKSSRLELQKLVQASQLYQLDTGVLPQRLSDLLDVDNHPKAQGPYIRSKDINDPWGQPYKYFAHSKSGTLIIYTLGSDHQPGGHGHASNNLILSQGAQKYVYKSSAKAH